MTCAGGASTTDLLLAWLARQQGLDAAVQLPEWFFSRAHAAPRRSQQRIPLKARIGSLASPSLSKRLP